MRNLRPRLLAVTAAAAALSILANGVGAVTAATRPIATRLGVSIAKDVAAQSAAATQRARTLDMREQAARATEVRLKAEIAAREAAAPLSGAGVAAPATGEQYDSLARVYQAMKPARAAPVFEQLAMEVQFQVAKRMRDRSTALIMAAMSPQGAADLSMALARKSGAPMQPAVRPVPITTSGVAAAAPAKGGGTPVAAQKQ